jgi:membrane fusion protein, multidrug efflux system
VIKRHFFLVAAAGLLVLMVLAVLLRVAFAGDDKGGGQRGGPGGRAQQVSQAEVIQRPFTDTIEVLGVARGRRSVDITSGTTELITRVLFRDGQTVAAGAPLVELQAGEEDAGIIQARAAVEQTRRDMERWEGLAERGIAPQVTAEQARTAFESASASLRAAQARRGDRVIRAPFAGVLGLSTVTAGTLVNPGAIIATLDDISVIRVDFPVPERYISTLSTGTSIVARSDAFPGQTFAGRIAQLDTRVDPQTRAVTARAEFANPGGRIRPGMALRVSIEQGQRQVASVPESAVQYEASSAFVYRIVAVEDASTAQRVTVDTGAVENGFVEILSGVNLNDRVVGSGLNRIQPGAPVTVARAGGSGRPAGATPPAKGVAP